MFPSPLPPLPGSLDFACSVEKIVLVDGRQLADLMIEYEVGATARAVETRSSIETASMKSRSYVSENNDAT